MLKHDCQIINKLGLHARAAAKMVETASAFDCDVHIEKDGRRVNAKSILGVMMLAAAQGTTVTIDTEGNDEEAAMEAMIALVKNRFGEGE